MTAEQLVDYAKCKILSKVSFDTGTSVKMTYLGQLRQEHFFVLTITPVSVYANTTAVKEAVEVLNKMEFTDPHWRHSPWNEPDKFYYYCCISNKAMIALHS